MGLDGISNHATRRSRKKFQASSVLRIEPKTLYHRRQNKFECFLTLRKKSGDIMCSMLAEFQKAHKQTPSEAQNTLYMESPDFIYKIKIYI